MGPGVPSVRAAVRDGADWSLQRALTIGYGVVYDYIFAGFAPYQALSAEILARAERAVPPGVARHEVRILDAGCGPGNITLMLGEAGFSVLGVDPYGPLIELAREKRRARHLSNVAFQHADLAADDPRWAGRFDQVVNVHCLYAHPEPAALLAQAAQALKPGGHAIVVNFTRRAPLIATFLGCWRRQGPRQALACLRWVLPNAVFEAIRRRVGPHYWDEATFTERLRAAGFRVLEMRRTFFDDMSLLAWARKEG
jgi:SAM-dependent methyltransferase